MFYGWSKSLGTHIPRISRDFSYRFWTWTGEGDETWQKPLLAAGIWEDNAQGWKVVQKMNIWPRSEASRETEILRTIFQPRALSTDMPTGWKRVHLFYNPTNNFSRRTHLDRSYIFCGFFRVSFARDCQPAFQFLRLWLPQKVFFCFAWPIKSLAWTFARLVTFIPSK